MTKYIYQIKLVNVGMTYTEIVYEETDFSGTYKGRPVEWFRLISKIEDHTDDGK